MSHSVLLLQPWVEDFYTTDCRIQPIGLAYLAASIQKVFPELTVSVFDALTGGRARTIRWPDEFAYLKPFYGMPNKGPYALFHQYRRFGKSEEEILAYLQSQDEPLLIGISSLFSPYYRQSLDLAMLCKRVFPAVPIVMGGNHATLSPETLLLPGYYLQKRLGADCLSPCDFVLRGEGEESICALISALLGQKELSEVPNLVTAAMLQKDKCLPPPLAPKRDEIAPPNISALPLQDYRFEGKAMTFLVTSRSCPHRCSFCSIHAVFGERYSVRPVDAVIREIEAHYALGIRHFDIEDDNFSFRRRHTHDLLDAIIALKRPLTLSAMNGLSYLSLDDELLAKLKVAGFSSLNLALVSSDDMVLRFSDRPHTVERFRSVVASANRLGLRVTAYGIFGMPGQSLEEMWETLRVLAQTQCLVGASPFYFTPGSPIERKERGNPRIRLASQGKDAHFSARLTSMDLECDAFDREDIYTLFRLTRVVNAVKNALDAGESEHCPVLQGYAAIFTLGSWGNGDPAPFSTRVKELIQQRPLTVVGYKTNRWAWSSGLPQWHSLHGGNGLGSVEHPAKRAV